MRRVTSVSVSLFATRDTEKCPLSVLMGLIYEKIFELSVGTNETVRYIRLSLLSGCPWRGVPLYYVRDRERNWPMADWRVPLSNDHRNNGETDLSSSSFFFSKVVSSYLLYKIICGVQISVLPKLICFIPPNWEKFHFKFSSLHCWNK